MVQNKFHYAITGQTAAEIINSKADKAKEHMGLTTWKNAPDGRILKSDVTIAKNYLAETEINQEADAKAVAEYDEFNKIQKITSDFDRELKRLEGNR